MKKNKIKVDPLMLELLITIYTFNNASAPFLAAVLKIGDAKLQPMLAQLTEIGILAGSNDQQKNILVKKDKARGIMMEHGVFYGDVKYFEAIYRYQQQIMKSHPALIQSPEHFILQKPDTTDDVIKKQGDEKAHAKSKKITKYLLISTAIAGAFALLVVMVPQSMSKFKRTLFGVKVVRVDNEGDTNYYEQATDTVPSILKKFHQNEKMIMLEKSAPDMVIAGRKGVWVHVQQMYLNAWVWSGDVVDVDE